MSDTPPGWKPTGATSTPPGWSDSSTNATASGSDYKMPLGSAEEPYPGNYQEHGDPESRLPQTPTSLAEDWRRVKEYVSSIPNRAGSAAWGVAETATELPLRKMATQVAGGQPAHVKETLESQGVKAPTEAGFFESALHPTMNALTVREHIPEFELKKIEAMPMEQQREALNNWAMTLNDAPKPAADMSLGANMENITARQALNAGVDRTIGRTERFLQSTVGKPLSQIALWAAKTGQPLVDRDPTIQAMKQLGLLRDYSTAEGDFAARELLKKTAGDDFQHPVGSPEEEAYNKALVEHMGPTGAKLYKSGVSLVGDLPMFVLPGSSGEFAVGKETALLRDAAEMGPVALRKALPEVARAATEKAVKQSTASALVMSGYSAPLNHDDFLNSLQEGSALGAFFTLLHAPLAGRGVAKELGKGLQKGPATGWGAELLNKPKDPNTRVDEAVTKSAVVPAKTMTELASQLDRIIERSSVKKVKKGTADALMSKNDALARSQAEQEVWSRTRASPVTDTLDMPSTVRGKKNYKESGREAAPGQEMGLKEGPGDIPGDNTPNELNLDVRHGKVYTPSYTKIAATPDGPVLRKVQLIAPTHASLPDVVETRGPSVTSKSGRRGDAAPAITAHGRGPQAIVEDIPIKSVEHGAALLKDASLNWAAMDDIDRAYAIRIADHMYAKEGRMADSDALGSDRFMAPEQASALTDLKLRYRPEGSDDPFFQKPFNLASPADEKAANDALAPWRKARHEAQVKAWEQEATQVRQSRPVVGKSEGGTDLLGMMNAPTVATVRPDDRIALTPVKAPEVRPPNSRKFKVGDFVMTADGHKGYVEGLTPEGDPLLRMPGSKEFVKTTKAETYLHDEPGIHGHVEAPTDLDARTRAIMAANPKFTLPDVVRWSGAKPQDMGWLQNRIHDLVDSGELKELGPGEWGAAKRKTPTNKDIETRTQGGQIVLYATGGDPTREGQDRGQWGILRGPDQRTKGNWLIEVPDVGSKKVAHPMSTEPVFEKTHYISVPEQDVRTKWPVRMADKSRVNPGIDAYGWTKPMPPQFIAEAPASEVKKMQDAWSRAAHPSMAGAINQKGDAIWHSIVGAMHQADPGIRTSKAQLGFNARNMMRSEALALNNFLEQRLGKGSNANQELAVILEQHRARSPGGQSQGIDATLLQNWAQKYPKEAAATIDDVTKMVAQLDEQHKFLADRGIGNLQDLQIRRANDEIPEYLTTNYAAFQMPRKEWAEFARKNLTQEWENALNYIRKVNTHLPDDLVADELDRILRLDNPLKGFQDAGYIKAEAKAKLGAKIQVPQAIADILGQHKDASMRLAFSLAYQRQLVKSVEAFDAIAMDPNLWSPGHRLGDMTLHVPDDPLFGKARNGYVNDNEATRLLIEGPKVIRHETNATLRAIGYLGGKWKAGHTVYNQASWVANVARNMKGVGLSPWDADAYREAAQMLADYHSNPTAYGPNKLLIEAMDFDAVGPGMAGSELSAEQNKFQRRIFDNFKKSQGGFMDTLGDIREMALSAPEGIHKGYDSIDKVAKFGAYLSWRRHLIALGYSIDDAAALSALRVNELFPNYTRHSTPEWASNAFGRGGLWAGMGPWATSKLQDIRVNGNIAKNLVGALVPPHMRPAYYDPGLAFRMLRLSAVIGGMASMAVNTRRMNGISDAQDALERSQIPIKSQKYSHLLIGSLDYDQHGRRVFYPMDTFEDLGMTLAGNAGDHPVARSILNNMLDVVGPDTIQGQVTQWAAAQAGVITPDQQQGAPRADQTGWLNLGLKAGAGLMPQAPIKAAAAYSAMNPGGRLVNPEALTPDQATLQGLGVKQMVVGPQTHKQTLMETKSNVIHHAHDIGAAATDAALNDVSGERRKYMIQSNVRALKQSINIPRPLNPNKGPKP